jgi:hypothetical protein
MPRAVTIGAISQEVFNNGEGTQHGRERTSIRSNNARTLTLAVPHASPQHPAVRTHVARGKHRAHAAIRNSRRRTWRRVVPFFAARPKSMRVHELREKSQMVFPGFKSRCTHPAACKVSSLRPMCTITCTGRYTDPHIPSLAIY